MRDAVSLQAIVRLPASARDGWECLLRLRIAITMHNHTAIPYPLTNAAIDFAPSPSG